MDGHAFHDGMAGKQLGGVLWRSGMSLENLSFCDLA
jgi:hypothetical protein